MNLIHNSRFTVPALKSQVALDYSHAMWRFDGTSYIQYISSENTALVVGETLTMNCDGAACKLIGWSGTKDRPTLTGWIELDINDPIPAINNIGLLVTGSPDKAFLGQGSYELVSVEDEIRACAYYGQDLSVDYHANEQIGYGRTINATQGHLELFLPYPIRGADGSAGVNDVSVSWGSAAFNATTGRYWLYPADAPAKRVSGTPILTCVHRNFLGFTLNCSGGAFSSGRPFVFRSYYTTQAEIDAAQLTEIISIDAGIHE
jgi:hypothetical protein